MTSNPSNNPALLEKIKEEYIYGTITDEGQTIYLSLNKLSKKHDFSLSGLKKQSLQGNWTAKKEDYKTKTELKVHENKSSHSAATIVQSDDKFENAGEQIRRVAVKQLSKIEERLDNDQQVRSIDILNIASTIRGAQEIVKTAQGEIIHKVEVKDVNVHDKLKEREEYYKSLESNAKGSD